MAKDPKKDEPKKGLSFFKKAKQEPEMADKPEEGKDILASQAQDQDSSQEQAGKDAGAVAVSADGVGQPKSKRPKKPVTPAFLPSLSLAVRALVILAIVVADAYAAYFLVVRVIGPNLAMAKVAQVRESLRPSEEHAEPIEVEVPVRQGSEEPVMGTVNLIEDLVVNPSGSEGTRYLCTTVALESIEPGVTDEITLREAQVRDVLIEILGKRSVEELATLDTRDQIREEIKASVNGLLSAGSVVGVYFSNFVLQ
jgi:flagellar FliL protein